MASANLKRSESGKLKALNPPVGVFFETEGFNTAESKNEFTLGIMSLVAQGE